MDDPLSEAKPAICETRDDFADGAATPETLADDLSRGLESPAALRAGLAAGGRACKACRSADRERPGRPTAAGRRPEPPVGSEPRGRSRVLRP